MESWAWVVGGGGAFMLVSVKQQQRVTITSVWLLSNFPEGKRQRWVREGQAGRGVVDPVGVVLLG